MIKKILKWFLVFIVVLIGIAFAAPFVFKGKIIAFVKKEINKNLNAKVDFKDVDISLFRHFPRVSVALNDLQVTGTGIFQADTLVAMKSLDAAVNIMSIIKGNDMTIYSVVAESPRIHAIVNKEGLANWDIVKDTAASSEGSSGKPFKMQLQQYAIHNAYISYKDESSDMSSEILNLNHEGSGDFTADLFTLKTTTSADEVTYTYGKIPFLSKAKVSADANIEVNNKEEQYNFNTDKILVNDLQLSSQGWVKFLTDGYGMDIKFNAPSTDFKNLLSLIPAIYKNDFNKIKTSGTAKFGGFVKGVYNEKQMPAYHVDLAVNQGFFQYPDLPKPVKNIHFTAQVDNPDGQPDNNIVDVKEGHIEMDNDPFDFRILVKKPISNMFVDAAAKGRLDLSKVSQLVKLEKDTKLSGLLNADVNVKGNVKDIEQQQYDKFTAGGTINLSDFLYVAKDYPTGIKIDQLATSFTPAKVDITTLKGQYLSSNFNGSGQINNLLNYMLQNKPLNANLTLNADNVNLNDWMGTSTDTVTAGPAAAPFAVPANLDVTLKTTVGKLHYDKIDIQNLSGNLKVKDESVIITDVKGNALDGTMLVNGSYSTKLSKSKPDIALTYDVAGVDVQKTFYAFNTVQQLMPIGKFIAGTITSKLSLNGKLGENMMPDMSTLTGNGNLLLIEGFLSKFAPLDKIAGTLNVKALEKLSLKDVKTYFDFSNGKLLVKPFKLKVDNIDMEIGGLQGFDQSLDYIINMKLPRSLMGEKGNQFVNNMVSQVNKKGVPLKVGEIINLNIKLGGFINNPSVKTDLKQGVENMADQLKQQVTDFVQAKIDSTKKAVTSAVKDTIASVKQQAVNAAKDEIIRQMSGNNAADSSKPKPKPVESVKGLMNDLLKKKKDTANRK